ncbi:MAG: SDR family oxidoreductase [Bacteroidetes bacterium]|nr:SDR family oxidoreductase [Bacteroidota bacterium]
MKNYLIIGASSGIGRQLALQLCEKNNRVYGTYNSHEPSEETHNLSYHPLNCLDEAVELSFLPDELHGLVYCPGTIVLKPFHRIKPSEFDADFNLQVIGAIKVIQAVLPKLKKVEGSSILLFSSVAAQLGLNFHSLVSTSKAALEGLTRALAAELSPGIRVNCIAPSLTNTPLAAGLLNTDEKIHANAQRHPLKRIGTVADIANMAEFLSGEKASWISGQVLHVDGGMLQLRT